MLDSSLLLGKAILSLPPLDNEFRIRGYIEFSLLIWASFIGLFVHPVGGGGRVLGIGDGWGISLF